MINVDINNSVLDKKYTMTWTSNSIYLPHRERVHVALLVSVTFDFWQVFKI